jgi:hypothetical protein
MIDAEGKHLAAIREYVRSVGPMSSIANGNI